MAFTIPPTPIAGASKGLIAGVSAGGTIILVAIIAFILWWKHRQAFIIWWKRRRNRSRMISVKTFDEHYSNSNEGKINLNSSTPNPISGNLYYVSNDTISPSRPVFPPEIQSDSEDNGNFSIRRITTLASLEKGTVMAPQGRQGQGTVSNPNSRFYGSTA